MDDESKIVTVLYHQENHKDRIVTILGVFTDKDPGSGKINAAIDAHMTLLRGMGIRGNTRYEYHTREGVLDKPETWIF